MDHSIGNQPFKSSRPHQNDGFFQKFKNPFVESAENQIGSESATYDRKPPDYSGSPGIEEASLSIRGNHASASRRLSYVSTSTSSPASSSSKRGSAFINLVSSEEDDDIADITLKKAKRNVVPEHHTQGKATSRSSSNTIPSHPIQYQAFRHVEIPSKESGSIIPGTPLAAAQRARFLSNLSQLRGPRVTVVNNIDESSPSTNFQFVNESVLGRGVSRAPDEVMVGCDSVPEFSRTVQLNETKDACEPSILNPDTIFMNAIRTAIVAATARIETYSLVAKSLWKYSRLKTADGASTGLRCLVDLQKGDFIDTYRGEIITVEEANARGVNRSADEGNYFMNFDKFTEPETITKSDFLTNFPEKVPWYAEKVKNGDWVPYRKDGKKMWLNPEYVPYLYVCDGMHVGGPTRFMNHSCDPNCRLFTVSYNHSDQNIYDLAFFTVDAIPAGTELTFDYKDEDDRSVITHEQALEVQRRDGYMPQKCLCGTPECRQYFFN
ncbi:MAG: hypothetical protein LQ343_004978 [Gyalolechia ehrenbergii]|nr:MAG: hypothetical protein LQ343_004978 [Gyalolechia ehrenbergii]